MKLTSLQSSLQKLRYSISNAAKVSHHGRSGALVLVMANALLLSACNEATKPPEASSPTSELSDTPSPSTKAKVGNWGVDLTNIAKDIKPGDDFYRYVNKGWLDTAKIPQGHPDLNVFEELGITTDQQIADLIKETAAKNPPKGSTERHVADFYKSYMDMSHRNQQGVEVLSAELKQILAANTRNEIASLLGGVGMEAVVFNHFNPMFRITSGNDVGNPQRYILQVEQSGLGLPNRDYYLTEKAPYKGYQEAYVKYIESVFARVNRDNAKARAQAILKFETQIAKQHWTEEQKRDPIKSYKVMSTQQLLKFAPGFDWQGFLNTSGFEGVNSIQLLNDSAIKAMAALFAQTSVETLRDYAAFHFLNSHAELLSDEWNNAFFELFRRQLSGTKEMGTLEQRGITFLNYTDGEEIGKLYVGRYYPPVYKQKTEELIGFVQKSVKEKLEKLAWMDTATRNEALAKLAKFEVQVGYPTQWHDYSSLNISKDDLINNVHQIRQLKRADVRAKLDAPKRQWEWDAPTQQVNASYSPELNRVTIYAGISQPPFFDPKADPAVNFGAMGAVIGHEIGHGFDDQGSQNDGDGKLRNWWTEASKKQYKAITDRIVARYNQYSPMPGVQLNGKLTLGENIGDLCGLTAAYDAYQKYAAANYPNGTPPVLDGFTGNQRFFLSFSQLWRYLGTPERIRQLATIDVHSPGEFRTHGTLPNFDPWYEAFGVTKDNALYVPKDKRIRIW